MRPRSVFQRPAFWWSAFATWFAVLFILSSFSAPDIDGPEIPQLDKLLHLVYFSAGGLCLSLALFFAAPHCVLSAGVRFVIVLASISLIGAFDEWHQTFTADRTGASVGDWLADTLGGAAAGAFGFFLEHRIPKGFRSPAQGSQNPGNTE